MMRHRGDRIALWVFAGAFVVGLVVFGLQRPIEARHRPWTGPHVTSDGWYYFHNTRSLWLDGDWDLTNEYESFGNWYGFPLVPETGRPSNPFGVGPALLWAPGFLVGHAIAKAQDRQEPWRHAHGYSPVEQAGALLTSYIAGWVTTVLSFLYARRFYGPFAAALGAFTSCLAGPLIWYSLFEPAMPHALEALTATAFLIIALPPWRSAPGWRRACALGVLGGLAALVRPQQAILLCVPAIQTVVAFVRCRNAPSRIRIAAHALLTLFVAVVVFLPQLWFWRAVYGQWLVLPQGPGFMRWGESMWSEVLFSSRNGLLSSHPALWLAMFGLASAVKRDRWSTVLLITLMVAQSYINGAAWDWWGGGAYGGRRMLGCSLTFCLGLSGVFAVLCEARRYARIRRGLAALLAAVLVTSQLVILHAYQRKEIRLDDPRPIAIQLEPVLGHVVSTTLAQWGNPFSFPANVLFGLRHHVSPGVYDYAVGPYLLDERVATTNPKRRSKRRDRMGFDWPSVRRFLGKGTTPVADGVETERTAELFVPLNRPGGLTIVLIVERWTPGRLTPTFNGSVYPVHELRRGRNQLRLAVAAEDVERGVNVLRLESDQEGVIRGVTLLEGRDWPIGWTQGRDAGGP